MYGQVKYTDGFWEVIIISAGDGGKEEWDDCRGVEGRGEGGRGTQKDGVHAWGLDEFT